MLGRRMARFNRQVLNHLMRPVARYLPGFGVVIHRGRRSGRIYETPVNVFRRGDGYVVALTYGAGADWVKNVLSRGRMRPDYPRSPHARRRFTYPA